MLEAIDHSSNEDVNEVGNDAGFGGQSETCLLGRAEKGYAGGFNSTGGRAAGGCPLVAILAAHWLLFGSIGGRILSATCDLVA